MRFIAEEMCLLFCQLNWLWQEHLFPGASFSVLGLVGGEQKSCAIVLSPLVALMVDQVRSLRGSSVEVSSGSRESSIVDKEFLATEKCQPHFFFSKSLGAYQFTILYKMVELSVEGGLGRMSHHPVFLEECGSL